VRIFRRERFALVHTHTPKTALLGQLAARIARVPQIVNTVHGLLGHDDVPMPRRAVLALIDRATCMLSSAVLSQSREDVDRAIARGLCRRSRIRHLGQGIDLERFDPSRIRAMGRAALRARLGVPETGLVIAMIARFTREKGYPEFLTMARRIARQRADVHFLVVGTSLRERDAVRIAPAEHGLAGRLTILVDRHDMPQVYAAADLVVLPTYREGFPRSLVEASAMGIPVVSTQIRGCREAIVHEETGLLVPPGNVDALYEAVTALCTDPDRRAYMGETASRRARVEFDERRVCDRVLALYRDLLAPAERQASPSNGLTVSAATAASPLAGYGSRR
jgi:glycosyltransferase involved in cell wall biosynthesis